jgi:hypothetical protein
MISKTGADPALQSPDIGTVPTLLTCIRIVSEYQPVSQMLGS